MKKIKKSLVERKEELEEQLAQMHEDQSAYPPDTTGQDIGDQTISSIMETLRNTLQDTEIGEYKRIVNALQKIEEGTYGICVDGNKEIAKKRLESYPNASRCVICQETHESGGFH